MTAAIFPRLCAAVSPRRNLTLPVLCLMFGVLVAMPLSATVNNGEIIPGSVSATVSSTYDPVKGVSVTFRWTTVSPGNSIVILENDLNYEGGDNSSYRQVVVNDYVTNHVVVVDHFPVYGKYEYWGYYVASVVGTGRRWATYPGPATASCSVPPLPGCGGKYFSFSLGTKPKYPNGPLVFSLWPVGGENVYQGDPSQSPSCTPTSKSSRECNDLYVAMQPNLLSGSPDAIVLMENAVITNLDTGKVVKDNSITAQFLCGLDAPSNPPPQGWDGDYDPTTEACSNGAIYSTNTTLRLRANSHAIPGHYHFTGSFQGQLNGQNSGNPTPATYNFTVLPTASFTATIPTTFPAIPGLSTWENNMVNFSAPTGTANADFWCTNNTDGNPWWSLDNGNFAGEFDIPSSVYFEAWNYDGGRVYQQILDYDAHHQKGYKQADPNEWQRCAELAMEPYKDMTIGTAGGFVVEPNQFPYGLAMHYMRTGDATYQTAVNLLANNEAYDLDYSGSAYADSVRVSAYMMDDRLANEIIGAKRNNAFMLRAVDVMLGYLDQSYNLNLSNPNQQEYDVHPFMVGLAMEALITYYELDLAEGNTPDARIPLEIKKTLDWWEATQYIPSTHTLAYGAYDVPQNPALVAGTLYNATELNDLVSPAFAWYWYKTNNTTYLNEGDDLFFNVWNSANGQTIGGDSGWTYSVKEYNQVYKGSFDYVRWRSGENADGSTPPVETVLAAANPYGGAWTDYSTPVQFEWVAGDNGNQPSINPVLTAPVVSATTATVWLNVFKPNTTLTVYYGTAAPGTCDINDPQPPNCMQPYPNFGFLQMLNANYANQSETTTDFPDKVALDQGIPNIYDATVTITGLTPNTTYHARYLTTDSLGNMAAYYDQEFNTSPQDEVLVPPAAAGAASARPARNQVFTRPAADKPCVDPSEFNPEEPVIDSRLISQMPSEILSSLTVHCARP
ncbi:MAG: hypothetical protein ACLP3R_01205 [Candidatus Korobacteraceae bacterium]